MNRISGLKHYVIYLIALAIIGVGMWIAYRIHGPIKIGNSQVQLQGQITGINQDSIEVYGTYINNDDSAKSDFTHPVLVKVDLASSAKFVRTTWLQPTADDLKTFLKPPFLARQGDISKDGVIGDLRNQKGMLVVVKADAASGAQEVTGKEVDYSLPTSYTGYGFSGQFSKMSADSLSASGVFFIQNSPAIFMSQGNRDVTLTITPTIKILKTVIPKVDPAHPKATSASQPVEVTSAQLASDIAANKNIVFNGISQTNVYGQASFAPTAIYYSVPALTGSK